MKKIFVIPILAFLVIYPLSTSIGKNVNSTKSTGVIEPEGNKDVLTFPCVIQISPFFGITKQILQKEVKKGNVSSDFVKKNIFAYGGTIDVGFIQIWRVLYEHLHCYPKIGFLFSYGKTNNHGNIDRKSVV